MCHLALQIYVPHASGMSEIVVAPTADSRVGYRNQTLRLEFVEVSVDSRVKWPIIVC